MVKKGDTKQQLLEIYNIIVFQFPHSTLKKYLSHFFYINMNMQVVQKGKTDRT